MPRKLGTLMLVVGLLLLAYPAFQWSMAQYHQHQMRQEVENPVLEARDQEMEADSRGGQGTAAASADGNQTGAAESQPEHMIIEIPALEVEAVVAPGTTPEVLAQGPGFYEETPMPWDDGGNVAIAAHRTTYGARFRHVDRLEEGDLIRLSGGGREFQYRVEEVFPVASNDWSVVDPTGYNALTLTTCHPPGSAEQRLVVRASMEK